MYQISVQDHAGNTCVLNVSLDTSVLTVMHMALDKGVGVGGRAVEPGFHPSRTLFLDGAALHSGATLRYYNIGPEPVGGEKPPTLRISALWAHVKQVAWLSSPATARARVMTLVLLLCTHTAGL